MQTKCVLITGFSSPIAKSCAKLLALHGFCVVGTGTKDEHFEESFRILKLDLCEKGSIQALICRLKELNLSPQYLINNAGIGLEPSSLIDVDEDFFLKVFYVNTIKPFSLIRELVKEFPLKKIVNVGSVISLLPLPFYGVYGASKSAFLDLTLSLRYELLNKEISVCAVIPNLTATDFIKHRIEVLSQDEYFSNKVSYIRELNKKSSKKADKPLKVAKVLVKVILKKSPQAVFYVGIKGYISALLAKILPQRLLYFFLTKILKL